jgi:hypothetical protein
MSNYVYVFTSSNPHKYVLAKNNLNNITKNCNKNKSCGHDKSAPTIRYINCHGYILPLRHSWSHTRHTWQYIMIQPIGNELKYWAGNGYIQAKRRWHRVDPSLHLHMRNWQWIINSCIIIHIYSNGHNIHSRQWDIKYITVNRLIAYGIHNRHRATIMHTRQRIEQSLQCVGAIISSIQCSIWGLIFLSIGKHSCRNTCCQWYLSPQ